LPFASAIVGRDQSKLFGNGHFLFRDTEWVLSEIAGFPIEFSETQIAFLIGDFPPMEPHDWFMS
jgi:hypothetical protein